MERRHKGHGARRGFGYEDYSARIDGVGRAEPEGGIDSVRHVYRGEVGLAEEVGERAFRVGKTRSRSTVAPRASAQQEGILAVMRDPSGAFSIEATYHKIPLGNGVTLPSPAPLRAS